MKKSLKKVKKTLQEVISPKITMSLSIPGKQGSLVLNDHEVAFAYALFELSINEPFALPMFLRRLLPKDRDGRTYINKLNNLYH